MTETLTADELDVEYILWEADDPLSRPCEATRVDCPNVALYIFRWKPGQVEGWPDCLCGNQRLCLPCKDYVLFGQPNEDGDFYQCRVCKGATVLASVEPIRS